MREKTGAFKQSFKTFKQSNKHLNHNTPAVMGYAHGRIFNRSTEVCNPRVVAVILNNARDNGATGEFLTNM